MKRGMSQIITTVILIGIALAVIGIVWYVINTVVEEQTAQVENSSSKVFQSCTDAGYYKMNTGDVCQGVVSYLGGGKCCQSGFVPNYGLISYWSFDVNASDDWGNNDGNVTGATWNTTGGFNEKGAYEFDGVDDYIRVQDAPSLNITGAITMEIWIYPKNISAGCLSSSNWIGLISKVQAGGYGLWIGGAWGNWVDETNFLLHNYTYYQKANFSNDDLQLNTWQHLVGTYDGSKARIYLNGTLKKEENVTGFINNNNLDLMIGAELAVGNVAECFFNGTIDEVRIYNRALSADEVKALYELN